MAPSVKHLSFLLFLLFLFNFYCPQTQARESQFFSKFTLHHNNLNSNSNSNSSSNITTSGTITNTTTLTTNSKEETKQVLPKEEAPLPKLNEEPTTSFTPENENGHGLYGDQESTQFPPTTPTTRTTATTSLAEAPTDDYVDATYEDNNNNPDALTEGPSETPTNEYTGPTYEENNNNNNNNNNNWSEMMKKQGMSDTRFMENGRYFYNVNTNTNLYRNGEYRSPSLKGNNQEGFGSSSRGGGGEVDNYNAAYNTFDDEEFNNYMEQDQFSDNNDQYVP